MNEAKNPPFSNRLQRADAGQPTIRKEQDDIVPASYTPHTLTNFFGASLPHQRCAKRVSARTARQGERSTTNQARAGSLRPRAVLPNTSGAGRTHMDPWTRQAAPSLPE